MGQRHSAWFPTESPHDPGLGIQQALNKHGKTNKLGICVLLRWEGVLTHCPPGSPLCSLRLGQEQAQHLTIKLVLDDVVEDFQEEEDQVVVLGGRKEEPGGGEGLKQVQQLV